MICLDSAEIEFLVAGNVVGFVAFSVRISFMGMCFGKGHDDSEVDDGDLPPRKYLIAVHTRCGRGKDHKVVVCRHEVSA
ncbi:MAG: hypothetical protein IJV91_03625 [Kiritimatiellae bacterium]|nr:hypothetical protein [Kiritimatiellia bacterium]